MKPKIVVEEQQQQTERHDMMITIDTRRLPLTAVENLERLRDRGVDLMDFAHFAVGELSSQPLEDPGFFQEMRGVIRARYNKQKGNA